MSRNIAANFIRTMLAFAITLALIAGFMPAMELGSTSYTGAIPNTPVSENQDASVDSIQVADATANVTVNAERMGIGGGGACFDPAISPFDPSEMAVGTDMGDVYVTHDAGGSWSKKAMGRTYDIQYDPTRPGVAYACGYLQEVPRSVEGNPARGGKAANPRQLKRSWETMNNSTPFLPFRAAPPFCHPGRSEGPPRSGWPERRSDSTASRRFLAVARND